MFLLLIHLIAGSICDRNLTDVVESIEFSMRLMHNVQNRSVINESIYWLYNSMNLTSPLHHPMNSYVGFDNNDFYMIKDCRHPLTYCERNDGWEKAGRPNFLGYVRNTHVYGDPRRHVYALDKDGNLL